MKISRSIPTVALALALAACSSEAPTSENQGPLKGGTTPAPTTTTPAPSATVPTPAASGTTTPPAGGACAAQSQDPCEVCAVQKCCTQIQACDADPQCGAVYQCAEQCQSAQSQQQYDTCIAQCDAKSPQGAQKATAIDQCVMAGCQAQCGAK